MRRRGDTEDSEAGERRFLDDDDVETAAPELDDVVDGSLGSCEEGLGV